MTLSGLTNPFSRRQKAARLMANVPPTAGGGREADGSESMVLPRSAERHRMRGQRMVGQWA